MWRVVGWMIWLGEGGGAVAEERVGVWSARKEPACKERWGKGGVVSDFLVAR